MIETARIIFFLTIELYHAKDSVDEPYVDIFAGGHGGFESMFSEKNWIDCVQWHLEDEIRNPEIKPEKALSIKRRIDKLNQERTDIVEKIDDWFYGLCGDVKPKENAKINTESFAWAIDRLSILCLKIYHMDIESKREDAENAHREKSAKKLEILREQLEDLIKSIDQLAEDVKNGERIVKTYKQMKMYNDKEYNPVLYKK